MVTSTLGLVGKSIIMDTLYRDSKTSEWAMDAYNAFREMPLDESENAGRHIMEKALALHAMKPSQLADRMCPHCDGDIRPILDELFECPSCGHILSSCLEFLDLTAIEGRTTTKDPGRGNDTATDGELPF